MGLFSRKNKASRGEAEETSRTSRALTDNNSMNRSASASAKSTRGRTEAIETRSGTASAPSSPRRHFSHSRNVSYTTDPEAPPVPQPPQFKYETVPVPPRSPRRSADYYSSRAIPALTYDNNTAGRHKVHAFSQSPPIYADSGYESNNGSYSALHSRAPSELNYHEESKQANSRNDGDFLPELKLGEGTLTQSIIAAEPEIVQTSYDSYFQRQAPDSENDRAVSRPVSPIDDDAEFRLPKSSRSSLTKRTRFQDTPEMPTLDQLQSFHCAPVTGSLKSTFATREPDYSGDAASYPGMQDDSALEQPSREPWFDNKYMASASSAPLGRARSSSSSRRSPSTLPPLSILEGFKVNKKGKILDEEGEPIGELVDGDLLDCVRQKANARGEVIDDYGRVVGTLRTLQVAPEVPTATGNVPSASQESQIVPAQPIRPSTIKPALSRLPNAPTLRAVAQIADPIQQTQINIPSPIIESTCVAKSGQLPEPVAVVVLDDTEEARQAHAPPKQSRSLEELPKQVAQAPKDLASPETSRRKVLSQSERSLSELSKPRAMTPVPENDVPADATIPDNPALYAFKGEIPADDRPQREARSRSPNVAINAKAALALGQPNSAMFGSAASGPYGHGNRMGPRRATTQFAGSYSNGTLSITPSNKPYRPSPLSSQETSPKRSDASDTASEEGRPYYSRASASAHSVAVSASKPRTYFTHGGKITVDGNTAPNTIKVEPKVAEVPPPTKEPAVEKKKGRLSMSFGRKTVAK